MSIRTTAELFQESSLYYQKLIAKINKLSDQISGLSPEAILLFCKEFETQQKQQIKTDTFILEIMAESGPEILDHHYVSEYQQALTQANSALKRLSSKTNTIKTLLTSEMQTLKQGQKGLAGYTSIAAKTKTTMQGHF